MSVDDLRAQFAIPERYASSTIFQDLHQFGIIGAHSEVGHHLGRGDQNLRLIVLQQYGYIRLYFGADSSRNRA